MKTILMALAIFASVILLGSAIALGPVNRAYAHTFQGSENVEFLTMVQQIKVETSLAGNNTSDKEVANHHMEHAAEALTNSTLKEIAEKNKRIATDLPSSIEQLKTAIDSGASADEVKQDVQAVSDLLDEAVQIRIEKSQVDNSTIQAAVVANLVNEALEHYGEAVGFEGNMTDMSAMQSENSSMQGNTTTTSTVVSVPNYQSSLAFAEKAQELYQQIKSKALSGTDNAVTGLDGAFPSFVNAIKGKASPMDIMEIAHTKIHPNLITAYNLQVAS
ncbi:hypothetical protein NTE_01502 [Candidatus Nitrososphaera evergladensis SR1]|jgi:Rad3-related DNA helicase|uniref:Uncharacterized protein n=1 Tax=Candidatus Nitrososphaera evergladensis SR1 TaxID=1459636 RepID=A0A075MR39_9ARCH|nr:hypothetical protein [Candidatus Nitrososphaera evergladensis]AIF83565.1 hypothetical protein NTE_01502 [Candidatus Nitrososphaera evergladensis SR1]